MSKKLTTKIESDNSVSVTCGRYKLWAILGKDGQVEIRAFGSRTPSSLIGYAVCVTPEGAAEGKISRGRSFPADDETINCATRLALYCWLKFEKRNG